MKFYDDLYLLSAGMTVTATITNRATGAKTTAGMTADPAETIRYVLEVEDADALAAGSYSYTARDAASNVVGDGSFDVDAAGNRVTLQTLAAAAGGNRSIELINRTVS